MATFFTSDTHFGHANIIKYCSRPFERVEEMDATLIANWNAVVRPGDEVWHLGDFAYRNAKAVASYARRLNGQINLIHGNHDSEEVISGSWWKSSQPVAAISIKGIRLFLCHYAMRLWPRSHRGALHFFGHSHGTLAGDSQSVDVGVDYASWGYRPVEFNDILLHLKTLPQHIPADYHGRR